MIQSSGNYVQFNLKKKKHLDYKLILVTAKAQQDVRGSVLT